MAVSETDGRNHCPQREEASDQVNRRRVSDGAECSEESETANWVKAGGFAESRQRSLFPGGDIFAEL